MLYEKLLGAVPEGTPSDPYFKNVSMLLPGDVNQSLTYTAFSDASTNNFLLTPYGDAYGTPFSPYNTSWSNYFDGSGDGLALPANANLALGTGDFTIEMWVYGALANNSSTIGGGWPRLFTLGTVQTIGCIEVYLSGFTTYCTVAISAGTQIEFARTSILTSSWNHFAITRSGTSLKAFVNGTQVGSTATDSTNLSLASTTQSWIGASNASAGNFNGYISNFRIVKGTAVYTGNFTPPSLANLATSGAASAACYSSTTNVNTSFAASATSLLTCQSNRFIDNSSNNFAITVNGNTAIKAFSPIADTDTTTGSGYFDGTGDRLTTTSGSALNLSTDDFTIEAFVYLPSFGSTKSICTYQNGDASNSNYGYWTYISSTGYAVLWAGSGTSQLTVTSATQLTLNAWNHIAITRTSNSATVYVNGTGTTGTTYSTINAPSGAVLNIGDNYGTSFGSSAPFSGYISNLRIVKGSRVYTGNFTPPTLAPLAATGSASAASYPSTTNVNTTFASSATSLLTLQTRGAVQNIGFIDSSPNKFPITKVGNTTQGTFSPYGNLWSNYFDGTGDSLSLPSNSAFGYGTGDFTIEFWTYVTSTANTPYWIDCRSTAEASEAVPALYINGGNYEYWVSGAARISGGAVPLNQWVHVALVRNGSTTTLYSNGTSTGTWSDSTNYISCPMIIGQRKNTTSQSLTGYISNLRIVKGRAVYTGNFTPSTVPLGVNSGGTNPPQGTETSLLTCQSNRFIDNSSNNFTLTVNGNTSVQRFSPFNPTAAYSAATIGGSGYFDGTGDYLATPSTGQFAPAGDFTVGVWFYPLALATYNEVIGNFSGTGTTADWIFEVNANGSISFYTNGGTIRISATAGSVKVGQWNYIALCRSGTTITGYVNGVSAGTYTQSGTFGSTTKPVNIGAQSGGYWYVNGYISDVKLIDGSAVTTVPTAPQTATTGTNLLLNFTNAGVWDAAMMNDLEAVGNARIVTTVKKYNTGSIYFDGTGDWITSPYTSVADFGSGNFTVEFWLYTVNNSALQAIINNYNGTSTSSFVIQKETTGKLGFYIYSSGSAYGFTSTNAVPLTTWTHVAFVRNGTSLVGYINGVNNGSTTTSVAANKPTGLLYIGAEGGTLPFNGYIDDLRITKGYARYPTEPFPTAALPLY